MAHIFLTATANFSSDGCFFLQFLIRCLVWFLISDPMFVFSISDQMFVLIPFLVVLDCQIANVNELQSVLVAETNNKRESGSDHAQLHGVCWGMARGKNRK